MLSENAACPSAISTPLNVKLFQSGLNRNSRPFEAFGKVTARTQMAIISTRSIGISTLLTFSMPFSTPKSITSDVSATNIIIQTVGISGCDVKSLKVCANAATS